MPIHSIRQVPKLSQDGKCYVCRKPVSDIKEYRVTLYNERNSRVKDVTLNLKYCPVCKIPYVDLKLISKVQKENPGLKICEVMGIDKETGVDYILKKIKNYPPLIIDKKTSAEENEGYKTYRRQTRRNVNVTEKEKSIKSENILIVDEYYSNCPLCNRKVGRKELPFIMDSGRRDMIPAQACGYHYQIKEGTDLRNLINDNPVGAERLFNKAVRLKHPIGYFLQIALKETLSRRIKFLCYSSVSYKVNDWVDYLDYHVKEARRILTQIFKEKRSGIRYGGINYSVINRGNRHGNRIIKSIILKKGGGLSRDTNDFETELVDAFLYSPFTKCYEIERVTYDLNEDEYYIDSALFRNFCRRFGNPGLQILIPESKGHNRDFSELNEESILHAFGYNVNQKNGLSDKKRQEILEDIIDLEIITVERAYHHIMSCITRGQSEKLVYARRKWERDLEFLRNYKANPERFIIAK